MNGHASLHIVADTLKDLHPFYEKPPLKRNVQSEVEDAYGHRGVPQLVALLTEKSKDKEKAAILHSLLGKLANQETKAAAIACAAEKAIIATLGASNYKEVLRLSCEALASLCQAVTGRAAVNAAGGINALIKVLTKAPVAATFALREMGKFSDDGAGYLQKSPAGVVSALVKLMGDKNTPSKALIYTAQTLACICYTEAGTNDNLKADVPLHITMLANDALNNVVTEDPAVKRELLQACVDCLQKLSLPNDGKTKVREAHAIDMLAAVLAAGDEDLDLTRAAASVLMLITIEIASKFPVMKAAGDTLMQLLEHPDAGIRANARQCLRNVVENLKARRLVEDRLGAEATVEYLGQLPNAPPDYFYRIEARDN